MRFTQRQGWSTRASCARPFVGAPAVFPPKAVLSWISPGDSRIRWTGFLQSDALDKPQRPPVALAGFRGPSGSVRAGAVSGPCPGQRVCRAALPLDGVTLRYLWVPVRFPRRVRHRLTHHMGAPFSIGPRHGYGCRLGQMGPSGLGPFARWPRGRRPVGWPSRRRGRRRSPSLPGGTRTRRPPRARVGR